VVDLLDHEAVEGGADGVEGGVGLEGKGEGGLGVEGGGGEGEEWEETVSHGGSGCGVNVRGDPEGCGWFDEEERYSRAEELARMIPTFPPIAVRPRWMGHPLFRAG
jgi:hypothetical protein